MKDGDIMQTIGENNGKNIQTFCISLEIVRNNLTVC